MCLYVFNPTQPKASVLYSFHCLSVTDRVLFTGEKSPVNMPLGNNNPLSMKLKVNRSFWTNGVCPELIHPRKQKLLLGSRWILQTRLSLGPITLLLFMETSEPRLSPLMEQSSRGQGATHAERRCAESRGSLWPGDRIKIPGSDAHSLWSILCKLCHHWSFL